MRNYLKQHIESGMYENLPLSGGFAYKSKKGWTDFFIHDDVIFSHRINTYTAQNFEEGLRRHDYFELVVYISGCVEYVHENDVITPDTGMIISSAPGEMHTARLLSDGIYERYVLYFNSSFFTYCGAAYPLPSFIGRKEGYGAIQPDESTQGKIRSLLSSIENAASKGNTAGRVLAYSYIIQLFSLLSGNIESGKNTKLPENVARIKKYIDTYYSSIEGVNEIASYFFYSREHASRLFRQYFNITLSDYLMQRRIAESTKLLIDGSSVSDACYSVGFRSVSSFINAFRRVTGCLPSEYKKKK